MSANLPTRPEFPFLTFGHKWCCKLLAFQVRPPSTSRSSGGGGEVLMMWYRYVGLSDKLWTHGGNLLNWEIRINSEISGWGVKLEWPDFESSKYSLIHICYMCGYVWFKRRTYTKTRFSRFQAFNHDESIHEFAPLQTARSLQPLLWSKERLIKRDLKITRSCEAKKD